MSRAWALSLGNLQKPESVVVHPKTGAIFISNVNGATLERDNNGYISKVSEDGIVVVLKFIEAKQGEYELHAPKGMVIENNRLFVTDLDRIMVFDTDTGLFDRQISLKDFEPKFLNDLTSNGNGILYASDMTANAIYRIDTRNMDLVELWLKRPELGQPNGLLYNARKETILIASWEGSSLLELDKDRNLTVLRKDIEKGLDGIAMDRRSRLYVSSFSKGEIYQIEDAGRGALSLFQSGLKTPADIYIPADGKRLYVPLMDQNSLTSYDL